MQASLLSFMNTKPNGVKVMESLAFANSTISSSSSSFSLEFVLRCQSSSLVRVAQPVKAVPDPLYREACQEKSAKDYAARGL